MPQILYSSTFADPQVFIQSNVSCTGAAFASGSWTSSSVFSGGWSLCTVQLGQHTVAFPKSFLDQVDGFVVNVFWSTWWWSYIWSHLKAIYGYIHVYIYIIDICHIFTHCQSDLFILTSHIHPWVCWGTKADIQCMQECWWPCWVWVSSRA